MFASDHHLLLPSIHSHPLCEVEPRFGECESESEAEGVAEGVAECVAGAAVATAPAATAASPPGRERDRCDECDECDGRDECDACEEYYGDYDDYDDYDQEMTYGVIEETLFALQPKYLFIERVHMGSRAAVYKAVQRRCRERPHQTVQERVQLATL